MWRLNALPGVSGLLDATSRAFLSTCVDHVSMGLPPAPGPPLLADIFLNGPDAELESEQSNGAETGAATDSAAPRARRTRGRGTLTNRERDALRASPAVQHFLYSESPASQSQQQPLSHARTALELLADQERVAGLNKGSNDQSAAMTREPDGPFSSPVRASAVAEPRLHRSAGTALPHGERPRCVAGDMASELPRYMTDVVAHVGAHDSGEAGDSSLASVIPSFPLVGFATARNRPVVVSEAAKARAAQLLREADDSAAVLIAGASAARASVAVSGSVIPCPPPSLPHLSAAVRGPASVHTDAADSVSDAVTIHQFVGFATARNRPVVVSEAAKARAAQLLREADHSAAVLIAGASAAHGSVEVSDRAIPLPPPPPPHLSASVRQTESVHTVSVDSAPGVATGWTMPLDAADNGRVSDTVSAPHFVGFATARNRPVVVSEAAKARAAQLLREADHSAAVMISGDTAACGSVEPPLPCPLPPPPLPQLPAALYRESASLHVISAVPVHGAAAGNTVPPNVADRSSVSEVIAAPPFPLVVFVTARNRPVVVSEAAKARAAQLLGEADQSAAMMISSNVDSERVLPFHSPPQLPPRLLDGTSVHASCVMSADIASMPAAVLTMPADRNSMSESASAPPFPLIGFATARNRPVIVSEAAKARAAQLLSEADHCAAVLISGSTEAEPGSLCPAHQPAPQQRLDRSVRESVNESLAAVRGTIPYDTLARRGVSEPAADIPLVGFATARNRPVAVSEAAKARAAQLLSEADATAAESLIKENGFYGGASGGAAASQAVLTSYAGSVDVDMSVAPPSLAVLAPIHSGMPVLTVPGKVESAGTGYRASSSGKPSIASLVGPTPAPQRFQSRVSLSDVGSGAAVDTPASVYTAEGQSARVRSLTTRGPAKSSFRTPRRLSGKSLADAVSRTANRVGFSVDSAALVRFGGGGVDGPPSSAKRARGTPVYALRTHGRQIEGVSERFTLLSALLGGRSLGSDLNLVVRSAAALDLSNQNAPSQLRADVLRIVTDVTPCNAGSLRFSAVDGLPVGFESNAVDFRRGSYRGPGDARSELLSRGCNPAFVSLSWASNHFRWIVLKLATTEKRGSALGTTPRPFQGYCSWQRVVAQLLYRYEREYAAGHRSTVQRVLECDVSSEVHMVLSVSNVHSGAGASTLPVGPWIELTDGWYCVGGVPADPHMARLISDGRVKAGMKLRVWGCALVAPRPSPAQCSGSNEQGTAFGEPNNRLASDFIPAAAASPLDCALNDESAPPASARFLTLHGNSTRPAPWHAKLGLQRCPTFVVSLGSLQPGAGAAPCVSVIVHRKLAMRALATLPGGGGARQSVDMDEAAVAQQVQQEELGRQFERELAALREGHERRMSALQSSAQRRRGSAPVVPLEGSCNDDTRRGSHAPDLELDELVADEMAEHQAQVESCVSRFRDVETGRGGDSGGAPAFFSCVPFVPLELLDTSSLRRRLGAHGATAAMLPHRALVLPTCAAFTVWRVTGEGAQGFVEGAEYLVHCASVTDMPTAPADRAAAAAADAAGHFCLKLAVARLASTRKTSWQLLAGPVDLGESMRALASSRSASLLSRGHTPALHALAAGFVPRARTLLAHLDAVAYSRLQVALRAQLVSVNDAEESRVKEVSETPHVTSPLLPRLVPTPTSQQVDVFGVVLHISPVSFTSDRGREGASTSAPSSGLWGCDVFLMDESGSVARVTIQGTRLWLSGLLGDTAGVTHSITEASSGVRPSTSSSSKPRQLPASAMMSSHESPHTGRPAAVSVGAPLGLLNLRFRYFDRSAGVFRCSWVEATTAQGRAAADPQVSRAAFGPGLLARLQRWLMGTWAPSPVPCAIAQPSLLDADPWIAQYVTTYAPSGQETALGFPLDSSRGGSSCPCLPCRGAFMPLTHGAAPAQLPCRDSFSGLPAALAALLVSGQPVPDLWMTIPRLNLRPAASGGIMRPAAGEAAATPLREVHPPVVLQTPLRPAADPASNGLDARSLLIKSAPVVGVSAASPRGPGLSRRLSQSEAAGGTRAGWQPVVESAPSVGPIFGWPADASVESSEHALGLCDVSTPGSRAPRARSSVIADRTHREWAPNAAMSASSPLPLRLDGRVCSAGSSSHALLAPRLFSFVPGAAGRLTEVSSASIASDPVHANSHPWFPSEYTLWGDGSCGKTFYSPGEGWKTHPLLALRGKAPGAAGIASCNVCSHDLGARASAAEFTPALHPAQSPAVSSVSLDPRFPLTLTLFVTGLVLPHALHAVTAPPPVAMRLLCDVVALFESSCATEPAVPLATSGEGHVGMKRPRASVEAIADTDMGPVLSKAPRLVAEAEQLRDTAPGGPVAHTHIRSGRLEHALLLPALRSVMRFPPAPAHTASDKTSSPVSLLHLHRLDQVRALVEDPSVVIPELPLLVRALAVTLAFAVVVPDASVPPALVRSSVMLLANTDGEGAPSAPSRFVSPSSSISYSYSSHQQEQWQPRLLERRESSSAVLGQADIQCSAEHISACPNLSTFGGGQPLDAVMQLLSGFSSGGRAGETVSAPRALMQRVRCATCEVLRPARRRIFVCESEWAELATELSAALGACSLSIFAVPRGPPPAVSFSYSAANSSVPPLEDSLGAQSRGPPLGCDAVPHLTALQVIVRGAVAMPFPP